MNLQSLFRAPIVARTYLDPGYSGHASDVWRVQTTQEVVVVRALREPQALDGPFWKGCHTLFGLNPRRLFDLEPLNALLAQLCPFPIPQVLRKGRLAGQPYVVVECMPGAALSTFSVLPEQALEELGKALACIHHPRFTYYGTPVGQSISALSTFSARLTQTMRLLVDQFYQTDAALKELLPTMCAAASRLPPLECGTLVLIDIDPTQFLTDGARITALVDTEAYAIGPRELDFIGLEYVLDRRGAAAIAKGYKSIQPLPTLSEVRPVYRYLYRLLEVQGRVDIEKWMSHPALFNEFAAD